MSLLPWANSAGLLPALAMCLCVAADVHAAPPPTHQLDELYLEVFINGEATGLIAAFRQRPEGNLAMTPDELEAIGLRPQPGAASSGGLVDLDCLDGISYRYDAASQAVHIAATDASRKRRRLDARHGLGGAADPPLADMTATGAVLNYNLFATTRTDVYDFRPFAEEANALAGSFDAWFYGPWSTFSQSATASSSSDRLYDSVRLDSRWSFSDQSTLITYRAGDVISGGLAWTRPVRLGGLQVQRDFQLRPDLVTLPMPELSGTAAVPSTVDVYANNVRVFSNNVPSGPFEISNIPVVTGAGTAQVVIHGTLGQDTVTTVPFYASSKMLRGGLYDFSVEAGYPRHSYGTLSSDYDATLAASATLRYGLSDRLTLEAHAEGTEALANAGAGLVFPMSHFGVASLAVAASHGDGTGAQLSGGLELAFGPLSFNARSQRGLGDYDDIASVTARARNGAAFRSARAPGRFDQAALSVTLPFDPTTLTVSHTHLGTTEGDDSRIVGLSLMRPVFEQSSLVLSASQEIGDSGGALVYLGLHTPLGPRLAMNTSASTRDGEAIAGVDVVRSEAAEPGSYGWRVRDREGSVSERMASASYRGSAGRIEGRLQQFGDEVAASAQIEGAIAAADGDVYISNRIDDAFAVVDVGIPGTPVFYENRPAGLTNANGKLLVTGLDPYQANAISIDPGALPIDAEVPKTKDLVVPGARRGTTAKFNVTTNAQSAILVLTALDGEVVPVGSRITRDGGCEIFVVGYDGEAFVRGLGPENAISVELPAGRLCGATFAFAPSPGEQVRIPLICS